MRTPPLIIEGYYTHNPQLHTGTLASSTVHTHTQKTQLYIPEKGGYLIEGIGYNYTPRARVVQPADHNT